MKRILTAVLVALALPAIPAVVAAHNAGHLFLPDGTCLELGSFHDAPLVGQDRTRLDLVPATPYPPFDEIGVSFVGHWGGTPIYPGPCGAPNSVSPGPSGSLTASAIPSPSPHAASKPTRTGSVALDTTDSPVCECDHKREGSEISGNLAQ